MKKKIGVKGGLRNIPDGYLIDLSGRQPRLYVVETELAAHDPLRHIAVQILEFSLSFKSEGRKVKAILFEALQKLPGPRSECEKYAREHGLRNLDRFLEFLVFETDFAALVIIDAIQENLDVILGEKFKFGVEVIEIQRYQNKARDRFYRFEPFLADVSQDVGPYQTDEVDTVVVPAHKDGAEETFLGEDRWYEIRIHGSMRPQIRYIALDQVNPVSAITHIATVKSIEPWKDSSKFVVNFSEPARPIGPIPLVKKGRVKALQNLRYTTRARLEAAKTLEDVW